MISWTGKNIRRLKLNILVRYAELSLCPRQWGPHRDQHAARAVKMRKSHRGEHREREQQSATTTGALYLWIPLRTIGPPATAQAPSRSGRLLRRVRSQPVDLAGASDLDEEREEREIGRGHLPGCVTCSLLTKKCHQKWAELAIMMSCKRSIRPIWLIIHVICLASPNSDQPITAPVRRSSVLLKVGYGKMFLCIQENLHQPGNWASNQAIKGILCTDSRKGYLKITANHRGRNSWISYLLHVANPMLLW